MINSDTQDYIEVYEGAYNTYLYGSLDKRNISGIQIEFPYANCRDTKEN